MSLKDCSIAFIGGGHITEIIVANLTGTENVMSRRLIVSDPVKDKSEKLQRKYDISIAEDNISAMLVGDFVFINAVMALSSPVIIYKLFQSMIDAGLRAGLDRETAAKIVYQTIAGSLEVWKTRQVPPYELERLPE